MLRPPLPELPLLKKELVGLLRTRRAFWFLIAAVAGSSLLSLMAWPSSVADSRLVLVAAGTFLLAQLTAALVVVPAFAAGAISSEREQGTYELLLATRLSPQSIVLSKAFAAASYVVILLVASAPCVIVLHLLGGVTFGSILRCQAVTLAAVVLATMVCLWASMRAARTSRAIVLGVSGVILWNGGFYWILSTILMIAGGAGWFAGDVLTYLGFALSPHRIIWHETFGGAIVFGGALSEEAWVAHVAFMSLVSACYLLLLLLRAGSPDPSAPERLRLGAQPAVGARIVRQPFLTTFLLDMGHDGGFLENPVFRKEIRTEFFGRLWYRRRRFWGLFILFGALVLSGSIRQAEDRISAIASISLLLIALLSPGISASSFPREIEHGNLDFLRGTLLSLREVLWGKFLASLYANFGIIAAAAWWMGIAGLVKPIEKVMVVEPLLAFGILAVTWVFVTAVGTCASAISTKTVTALVGSYGALFAWLVGLPMVAGGFFGLTLGVGVATHPAIALVAACRDTGYREALFFFFFFQAGGTLLLLELSSRAVERLRGRDP